MATVLGDLLPCGMTGARTTPHTPFLAPCSRAQGGQKQEGVILLLISTLACQDVNLKIPRNNQLLHFAFREDKQWKLQQVVGPFPYWGSGHKGRQGQA